MIPAHLQCNQHPLTHIAGTGFLVRLLAVAAFPARTASRLSSDGLTRRLSEGGARGAVRHRGADEGAGEGGTLCGRLHQCEAGGVLHSGARNGEAKVHALEERRFPSGYLEDHPDYVTQGETGEELLENLKDLNRDITGEPSLPLSTEPEDPNIIDPDDDGNPGVTVRLRMGNLFEGEIHITRRKVCRNRMTLNSD